MMTAAVVCLFLVGAGGEGEPVSDEAAPAATVQPAEPEPEPTPRVRPDLTVRVVHVLPDGTVSPLSGATVHLEQWASAKGPMSGGPTLTETWSAVSSDDGLVAFSGVDRENGASLVATTVRDGMPFRTQDIQSLDGRLVELRVYDITPSLDGVEGTLHMEMSVRDGFLIITGVLGLSNPTRRVVHAAREGSGLRFPVPLPAVFDTSLDLGFMPPETSRKHMAVQIEPNRGRMVFERGGLFYDGPILPGVRQSIEVRYALPITDERMDLAFRSEIPLTMVVIGSMWSDRVAPRVVPNRPFMVRQVRRGESFQRVMRVLEPPPEDTALLIRVDRLPRPLKVQGQLAIYGSLFLLGIFGLALIRGRMRHG